MERSWGAYIRDGDRKDDKWFEKTNLLSVIDNHTSMSPLDYALHPHIQALQRAQNVTPHLYNTDYYITKLNRLNIICLLKHSLVSSTIVISVVSTFNIALVF